MDKEGERDVADQPEAQVKDSSKQEAQSKKDEDQSQGKAREVRKGENTKKDDEK